MSDPVVEIDAEAIPGELKERDQWLHWDASADTPRRPHWRGNFGVSWTDPDDWHSFEEALSAAESNDSWGIGFVFANDNDDYLRGIYSALDLDGCVEERGRPKEWLPSLAPFIDADAYMEYSPSGEGIHIPLVGFEVPGWWSDCHFSAEEHEGVEAYESKFFTVTGDALEAAGDDVGETPQEDVEDWLADAHEAITGDDPRETYRREESTGSPRSTKRSRDEIVEIDTTSDFEDVLDAVDHLAPADVRLQSSYQEDENAEVESWDPGYRSSESGLSLKRFTDADVWVDMREMDEGFDTLALIAAEEGIIREPYADLRGEEFHEAVNAARDRGAPIPEFDGDRAALDDPERPDPDPSELDWDEVERAEELLAAESDVREPAGELVYRNGCYGIPWKYTDEDGNVTSSGVDTVCNFALETVSFLNTEEGTDIVVRVLPQSPMEDDYEVRIDPSVFNSTETFKREIVTGTTTWFDTSNREHVPNDTILRYLRETVGTQPAPHRTGTPHIGLAETREEYVTPVGSLTADGWSDDPGFEFYTKGGEDDETGALPQKWTLDPADGADYDSDEVARICELLPRIRKRERGVPILGWFYAAALKPYIHDWEDEFPLLAPHGDTGSGKTSGIRPFMKAFGGDGEPFSASDTSFTIEKHLAESRGFPIWFDEYKPTEMAGHRLKRFHRRLKEVTKERTLAKGTPDLGEVTLHLRAPVLLSGEQKITDAAVRRRAIITNLSQAATRDGTETKAAFGELTGTAYEDDSGEQHYPSGYDLSQHALAYYQWVLQFDEDELVDAWQTAREKVKTVLGEFEVTVEESEQRGLQTVAFGVALYRMFAQDHGADPAVSDADLRDAFSHVVENIGKDGHRREHADEFLEVMTLAATEGYLEDGVHHRLMSSQKFGGDVLAVHFPSTFTNVQKFVRDSNLEDNYTILQKNDYIDSFGNKADDDESYVQATNHRVRGMENGGKAIVFDPDSVTDKLGADFNLDAFTEADLSEDDADQDDPAAGATPISGLTPEGNPYETVTVQVKTWGAGPEGTTIAETGTVTDETGVIDVIDFFGCDRPDDIEGGTYRLENVRVNRYEGSLQLEIVQGVTEWTQIQQGVGYTESADSGANQDIAATDGSGEEFEGVNARVANTVRTELANTEFTIPQLAGKIGEDPETVSDAVDRLAQKGVVRDVGGGEYRAN